MTELIQNKELYEKDYDISSYLINTKGRLGLYALLNLLQDIAHFHANLLGFGYEDMVAQKTFWVLTRQKLVMNRWPKWDEKVRIKTWIRLSASAFTNRDFAIYLNNEKIGECTTSWMTLDAETRRPKSIDYKDLFKSAQTAESVSVTADKLTVEKEVKPLADFKVRNSDIDQNYHVNNTKYSQWILDAIPFELHHQYELKSYAINFLAETKLNDSVKIVAFENAETTQFQGIREADQKIAFVANIEAKKH